MMEPYIQKLIVLKLLNHKDGLALEVGTGPGEDAKTFNELGYSVESFDKKQGQDLRDFNFEKNKYDFINCNNVLPFVHNKDEVKKALMSMSEALKDGGTFHLTLFGENDPWKIEYGATMSFYSQVEAEDLVNSLNLTCVLKTSEEGMGKKMDGSDKLWHKFEYFLSK